MLAAPPDPAQLVVQLVRPGYRRRLVVVPQDGQPVLVEVEGDGEQVGAGRDRLVLVFHAFVPAPEGHHAGVRGHDRVTDGSQTAVDVPDIARTAGGGT